jgi:hypothetical protein
MVQWNWNTASAVAFGGIVGGLIVFSWRNKRERQLIDEHQTTINEWGETIRQYQACADNYSRCVDTLSAIAGHPQTPAPSPIPAPRSAGFEPQFPRRKPA